MKFRPLSWRISHPYILADRFEDITPPDRVQTNRKCDRNITLYGYLRGCNMKKGTKVRIFSLLGYMCVLVCIFSNLIRSSVIKVYVKCFSFIIGKFNTNVERFFLKSSSGKYHSFCTCVIMFGLLMVKFECTLRHQGFQIRSCQIALSLHLGDEII